MAAFTVSSKRGVHLVVWFVLTAVTAGCSSDTNDAATAGYSEESIRCLECHNRAASADDAHRLDCVSCHLHVDGDDTDRGGVTEEHPRIVAMPAHPDHSARTCGTCHEDQTAMVLKSDHYRLSGHIETIRAAFGVDQETTDAADNFRPSVASHTTPETTAELVDDLLSRRCLRCHVYDPGDPFEQVAHGTGCAACHLDFSADDPVLHAFSTPASDTRCLSCHYGNHVGFDYYGRYEHDLNEEYRTPYGVDPDHALPYGVEYHQLAGDVHQAAAMLCVDCHGQEDIMGDGAGPACLDCHDSNQTGVRPATIAHSADGAVFTSHVTGKSVPVPQMTDKAHERYGDRFSCQVCHAQWGFNDGSVHLLRIDHEEFYDFYKLSVDGSYEVHRIIDSHISDDGDLYEPFMTDKFTGESVPGIWFRGFVERRWELLELVEGGGGIVRTARPILDLHLSWIDYDEELRFDTITPTGPVLKSYAPHTIGKAGLLYESRIKTYLEQ